MPGMIADRIEKQIVLRAPRWRVWRALTSADEFGSWFGVKIAGPFVEGETVRGQITHPGYEHLTMRVLIERVHPEEYFAWRWHPHAIDPTKNYSAEPTTLVEFRLRDVDGGTELSVVESGFSRIPLERRDQALRMNEGGWASQMANIERHVSRS